MLSDSKVAELDGLFDIEDRFHLLIRGEGCLKVLADRICALCTAGDADELLRVTERFKC